MREIIHVNYAKITSFEIAEKFAEELVQMFSLELCLKVNCNFCKNIFILYLIPNFGINEELTSNGQRLLVLEFMSIGYDPSEVKQLHWSTQLYDDEFKDLRDCNLYCEVTRRPVPPRFRDGKSDIASLRFDNQPNPEVLQVLYLISLLLFEFSVKCLHLRFKYIKIDILPSFCTTIWKSRLDYDTLGVV